MADAATAARRRGEAAGRAASLHWTRAGGAAAVVGAAILVGALNTGNNLLYLLAACLFGALGVSAWISRWPLARARVELALPDEVRARDPVEVVVRTVGHADRPTLGVAVRLTLGESTRSVAVPWLDPGERRLDAVTLKAPVRGAHVLRVSRWSPFPCGLLEARAAPEEREVLVLPRSDLGYRRRVRWGSGGEGLPSGRRGPGTDLLEIRDWAHGDDARAIDWKSTARLDRTMVRETSRDADRRATVVLDPGGPLVPEDDRERAVSLAAGAVEDLTARGWRVRLVLPDGARDGEGRDLLRALAMVRPNRRPLPPRWWSASLRRDEGWLVFEAGRGQP